MNGYWLKNPRNRTSNWARYVINSKWYTSAKESRDSGGGDINKDGRPDVILSDSEPGNISQYSSNNQPVAAGMDSASGIRGDYAETLHVADVDKDGDLDIAGTLKLTNKTSSVDFQNHGNGSSWIRDDQQYYYI